MAKGLTKAGRKRRKPGPPRTTGKGKLIGVRLHADILDPLDEWIAEQPDPKPTQQEAIREGLRDWLTGMGKMPPPAKKKHKA